VTDNKNTQTTEPVNNDVPEKIDFDFSKDYFIVNAGTTEHYLQVLETTGFDTVRVNIGTIDETKGSYGYAVKIDLRFNPSEGIIISEDTFNKKREIILTKLTEKKNG
jgi:hypothetical protein